MLANRTVHSDEYCTPIYSYKVLLDALCSDTNLYFAQIY